MAHVSEFVIAAGRGLQGDSLGYHAYSLRLDNLSNQWMQEQSTLAWIPPYSLGTVLRLYGTSVAMIARGSPTGQAQLAPISGEYAVAVYSSDLRVETPGVPVRQFELVQAVSDLTLGPQPATPVTGTARLWADSSGKLHVLNAPAPGVDALEIDNTMPLGGDLSGFLPSPSLAVGAALNNLGSRAIVDIQTARFSTGIATGSATMVGTGDAINYTPPNPNGLLLAIYQGVFADSTLGAIGTFGLGWRGVSPGETHNTWFFVANMGVHLTLVTLFANPGAGAGILQMWLGTNSGVVSAVGTPRVLTLVQFNR